MPRFEEKLATAQQHRSSDIALLLSPRLDRMPLPIQRYDDPFLPFSRAIIEATQDIVCTYIFDFAAYMALAGAGARALERAIGLLDLETVKIIHGPFVGPAYSAMTERTAFDVDAITVYRKEDVDYYRTHAPYGAIQCLPAVGNATLFASDQTTIRVTDEDALFRGHGDDFAEQVRAHILTLRGHA